MVRDRGNAQARLDVQIPVMLETSGFEDYALIDSGDGSQTATRITIHRGIADRSFRSIAGGQ